MANKEFIEALNSTVEVELTAKNRRTGKSSTRPVWFVLEGEIMYELEKGKIQVQKGKGFFLPSGTKHRGHNVFPGVTRFFLIDE